MNVTSPSDLEKERIEAMIASNKSELAAAEEIAHLCRLKEYELRRRLNAVASPMSSLPQEVMSEIFLNLCATPLLCYMKPDQFVIGSVCNKWREIAWSTPRLWSAVRIEFSEKYYGTQPVLLEEWLKRGRNCPLDIEFTLENPYITSCQPPKKAFRTLAKNCSRWKKFKGYALSNLSLAMMIVKAKEFPLLETLHLLYPPTASLRVSRTRWKFDFNSAPLLRNLHIRYAIRERDISINWTSLTHLSTNFVLRNTDASKHYSISFDTLASCKSLKTLHSSVKGLSVDQTPSQQHCLFPYLEELKLWGDSSVVTHILGRIITPALKTLDVKIFKIDPTIPWETSIIDMANRSSFKLEALYIDLDHPHLPSDDGFVNMLQTLSRVHPIHSLSLETTLGSGFSFSNCMVDLLTMKGEYEEEQQKEHLPFLTNFRFLYADIVDKFKTTPTTSEPACVNHSHMSANPVEDLDHSNSVDGPNDHSVGSPAGAPLAFFVDYTNRNWFQSQHPNSIQSFYLEMEKFTLGGNSFYLHYLNGIYEDDNEFEMDTASSDEDEED